MKTETYRVKNPSKKIRRIHSHSKIAMTTINGNIIEGFQSRMQPTFDPGAEQYHVGELYVLQDQLSQHQRERYRPFQDENANNGMYGIVDGGSNQTQCGFSFQELGMSSWTDRRVRQHH